jgi:hypothetical protein
VILCRSRRFLFVKTQKTAGTSLEVALAPHCDDGDVVTPIDARDAAAAPGHRARNAGGFFNHMPLAQILAAAPEAEGFFRFTAERNPWDKVVSKFHFERPGEDRGGFRAWLDGAFARGGLPLNWPLYALDGRPGVDFVIRYETLAADFGSACERIGIEPPALPRVKAAYRPEKGEYRSYYDPATRDAVARAFHREIAWWGYAF